MILVCRGNSTMTPEQFAAHLGDEVGDALLMFLGSAGLQAGGRATAKAMDTVINLGKELKATHTLRSPLLFQFEEANLYSGFPFDAIKVQQPIVAKAAEAEVIVKDIAQGYAQPKLTKGQIVDYLENVHLVPRNQLISDLESVGLKYAEGNGDGSVCKFVRYKNNNVIDNPVIDFRVEIHTAHLKRPNGAKYAHIHIYDKIGNSLDKNLITVKNNSPDAHIKVKDLAEIILTLRPL